MLFSIGYVENSVPHNMVSVKFIIHIYFLVQNMWISRETVILLKIKDFSLLICVGGYYTICNPGWK